MSDCPTQGLCKRMSVCYVCVVFLYVSGLQSNQEIMDVKYWLPEQLFHHVDASLGGQRATLLEHTNLGCQLPRVAHVQVYI